ncbi:MAG: hypothetical protein RIQ56_676 [Candidatus Parcubacteria bacterium]|jgi:hypothetical protein
MPETPTPIEINPADRTEFIRTISAKLPPEIIGLISQAFDEAENKTEGTSALDELHSLEETARALRVQRKNQTDTLTNDENGILEASWYLTAAIVLCEKGRFSKGLLKLPSQESSISNATIGRLRELIKDPKTWPEMESNYDQIIVDPTRILFDVERGVPLNTSITSRHPITYRVTVDH